MKKRELKIGITWEHQEEGRNRDGDFRGKPQLSLETRVPLTDGHDA